MAHTPPLTGEAFLHRADGFADSAVVGIYSFGVFCLFGTLNKSNNGVSRILYEMQLNVLNINQIIQPKLTRVITLLRMFLGSRRATVSELKECSRSLKKKLRISLPFSSSPLRRDSQRSICGSATLTM